MDGQMTTGVRCCPPTPGIARVSLSTGRRRPSAGCLALTVSESGDRGFSWWLRMPNPEQLTGALAAVHEAISR
jgi:hypothetical protein